MLLGQGGGGPSEYCGRPRGRPLSRRRPHSYERGSKPKLENHTGFQYEHRVPSDDAIHFEWDDAKAASNVVKHRVSFEAAAAIFEDRQRLEEDDLFVKGEYRVIAVGEVDGVILAVVYAEPEENLVRIVSARKATAQERKAYEQNLIQT